jgi:serine/threonine protein kinase
MPKRLLVFDGPDKGQSYLLPEAGAVRIGASRKNTDICLHDLFVARVHCQVELNGDRVTVCDNITPNGILVNGAKVTQQEIHSGDVIRVGNSYLRLEEADAAAAEESAEESGAEEAAEAGEVCHLPLARLGELAGEMLGHYEIGEVLARGHTGVVFRARDEKTDQRVALKVLPPVFPATDPEMHRFVRAMKTRLAVQHPGLVALRGVGKSGAYVWIATDLVEGESVSSVVRHWHGARRHKWRLGLRVALHLARVLDHIRGHRLVHANIAPANVLLPADDGPPRLNDLGLRDALVGSTLQQQTWERKFLAELPYLSPEHVDPDARVDDLSDQYCLGAVVYALLTGRPPFAGESPDEIIEKIRDARPGRPKEAQRSLPDAFQAVVLRMLAKHPEERYPAPGPLVADLEAIAAEHDEEE